MTLLTGFIAVFFVLIPLGLLFWVWRARTANRAVWLGAAAATGSYLLALSMTSGWQIASIYWKYALIVGCVALVLATVWRVRREPWFSGGRAEWAALAAQLLIVALSAFHLARLVSAWDPPSTPVDVAFPLRDGMIYSVSAGGSEAGNPHMMVLADQPRFEPWRGQAYAVDAVALNSFGRRSSGIYPSDPTAYVIFDMPLHAPCAGEVVHARDGLPDLPPPESDTENKAGNVVVIRCEPEHGEDDIRAVLAHIRQGTVRVDVGQTVTVDTEVGRVGNSGKTSEPHLHVHLQRGGSEDEPLSGEPVPATFRGTYPVQGDILCPRPDGSLRRFPCSKASKTSP